MNRGTEEQRSRGTEEQRNRGSEKGEFEETGQNPPSFFRDHSSFSQHETFLRNEYKKIQIFLPMRRPYGTRRKGSIL